MAVSKNLRQLKEPLDIDVQLMVSELDTSANNVRFISKSIITDNVTAEKFDALVNDIEKINGIDITSFDDNTILYEYMNDSVVIHTVLSEKYILFDVSFSSKIEEILNNF